VIRSAICSGLHFENRLASCTLSPIRHDVGDLSAGMRVAHAYIAIAEMCWLYNLLYIAILLWVHVYVGSVL